AGGSYVVPLPRQVSRACSGGYSGPSPQELRRTWSPHAPLSPRAPRAHRPIARRSSGRRQPALRTQPVREPIPSALLEIDEIGALGDLALARLARRRRALAQGGGRLGGLGGLGGLLRHARVPRDWGADPGGVLAPRWTTSARAERERGAQAVRLRPA